MDHLFNSGLFTLDESLSDIDELDFKFDAALFTLCKPDEETFCSACSEVICGQAYYKKFRNFWIHESCSKLPRQITHPLHPHHTLTLRIQPTPYIKSFICNGCGDYCTQSFTFNCKDCEFNLCVSCGLLIDDFFSKHDLHRIEERNSKTDYIHHFSHPRHSLRLCNVKNQHEFLCGCCKQDIIGSAYVCSDDCNFFVHESCTKFPRHITHPIHPHTPTLLSEDEFKNWYFICNLCRDLCIGFRYTCKLCGFNIDVNCHSLMDSYLSKYGLQERDRIARIDHYSHYHILEQCNFRMLDYYCGSCCYCNQNADDGTSIYICLDCKFFIHESCKDKMQQEVQYSWHPGHTFRAVHSNSGAECKWCKGRMDIMHLNCQGCNFNLHYFCAKYLTRPLKLRFHEHNLFFLSASYAFCFLCYDSGKAIPVYRCLDCFRSYHIECSSLPHIVDSKCHDHPLRLFHSIEYDFDHYYCDICEELGDPKHHLYYCEECPYFAHIDCAITEDDDISLDDIENKDQAVAKKELTGSSDVSATNSGAISELLVWCFCRKIVAVVLVISLWMIFWCGGDCGHASTICNVMRLVRGNEWCDGSRERGLLKLDHQEEHGKSEEDIRDLVAVLDKEKRVLELEIAELTVKQEEVTVKLEQVTRELELLRRKLGGYLNVVGMIIRRMGERIIISLRERLVRTYRLEYCFNILIKTLNHLEYHILKAVTYLKDHFVAA